MPIPVVWSEREYPHYRDCAWSMVLDLLVYAGFKQFPNGIYSNDEREALERAGSHIPETGTTIAQVHENLKNRYHLDIPALSVPLSTALNQVGTGLGLYGVNGNLPAGDHWRRWDPTFTGIHAVSVYPLGNGQSRILDPEAPMGFQGDTVPNSTVVKWVGTRTERIVVRENQFQRTFLGWNCDVHEGVTKIFRVARYTHAITATSQITNHMGRDTHAPVAHGIPGFWMITKGPYFGWYLIWGKSGTFGINEVYRLGNGQLSYVPANTAR